MVGGGLGRVPGAGSGAHTSVSLACCSCLSATSTMPRVAFSSAPSAASTADSRCCSAAAVGGGGGEGEGLNGSTPLNPLREGWRGGRGRGGGSAGGRDGHWRRRLVIARHPPHGMAPPSAIRNPPPTRGHIWDADIYGVSHKIQRAQNDSSGLRGKGGKSPLDPRRGVGPNPQLLEIFGSHKNNELMNLIFNVLKTQ